MTAEHWAEGAATEHGERDERSRRVKTVGTVDDQADASVDHLDQGIREPVLEGRDHRLDVIGDPVSDRSEGFQTGALQPVRDPRAGSNSRGIEAVCVGGP